MEREEEMMGDRERQRQRWTQTQRLLSAEVRGHWVARTGPPGWSSVYFIT
jgi:hypothetical protein